MSSNRAWFSNGGNEASNSFTSNRRKRYGEDAPVKIKLVEPEERELQQLLQPFSDLPPKLPPNDILARITSLSSSTENRGETAISILTNSSVSSNFNPTGFRWGDHHSDALDDLLDAASSSSSSRVKLDKISSKKSIAESLCQLCGLAQLAVKFDQADAHLDAAQAPRAGKDTARGGWTRKQTNKALDILYDYCEDGDSQVSGM